MSFTWLNGQLVDENAALISIRDGGVLHAAGVFTTMRAAQGRVIRLAQHLARLRESCPRFAIPLPYSDAQLTDAVGQLLRRNDLPEARLRLTATRGVLASRAAHSSATQGCVFLTASAFEPYPAELYIRGMSVVLADQKLNPYDIQAGHKTLNYLSRLAALQDARQAGADEAIWQSVDGWVESGSTSNVFVVRAGRLLTPPTRVEMAQEAAKGMAAPAASAVLPGITRRLILELAERAGIAIQRPRLEISTLLQADECFLSNSLMGIMPVCRVGQRPLGSGRPGELTTQLMRMYEKAIEG